MSESGGPAQRPARSGGGSERSRDKPAGQARRAERRTGRVTEADLLAKGNGETTPDDVLALGRATDSYLCSTDSEDIAFTKFRVRDMDSGTVLFEVVSPAEPPPEPVEPQAERRDNEVHYVLPADVLRLKRLGAFIEFKVGQREVKDFRMIEVHYFGERRLKFFDFNFGFCIPGSVNTCEHIYELPELDERTIQAMVDAPKGTKSDSFYFADGKLFMHNKCVYTYTNA